MSAAPGLAAPSAPTGARRRLGRAVAFAAATWLLTHLVHALGSLGSVEHAATYAAGIVLWLGGSALALRPLVSSRQARHPGREAVVLAVLVPVVSALDVLSLVPADIATYANWANGGTAVMLVALVMRRHGYLALAAGAALLAVQTVAALGVGLDVTAANASSLFVPVSMWLLGGWAVRRHVRGAERLAAELRFQRAAATGELLLGERWGHTRARHHADLDDAVLPLLREVVSLPPGAEVAPEQRARARELSGHLRDVLLARSLMSRTLQGQVRAARARGARVMLHNVLEDGEALQALRDLAGRLLELPGLELLSVRTFVDPGRATLVLRGDEAFATGGRGAVESVIGGSVPWWSRTDAHDLDGDVMVQLSGPHVD